MVRPRVPDRPGNVTSAPKKTHWLLHLPGSPIPSPHVMWLLVKCSSVGEKCWSAGEFKAARQPVTTRPHSTRAGTTDLSHTFASPGGPVSDTAHGRAKRVNAEYSEYQVAFKAEPLKT
jgi:hypothetical protein